MTTTPLLLLVSNVRCPRPGTSFHLTPDNLMSVARVCGMKASSPTVQATGWAGLGTHPGLPLPSIVCFRFLGHDCPSLPPPPAHPGHPGNLAIWQSGKNRAPDTLSCGGNGSGPSSPAPETFQARMDGGERIARIPGPSGLARQPSSLEPKEAPKGGSRLPSPLQSPPVPSCPVPSLPGRPDTNHPSSNLRLAMAAMARAWLAVMAACLIAGNSLAQGTYSLLVSSPLGQPRVRARDGGVSVPVGELDRSRHDAVMVGVERKYLEKRSS